MKVTLKQIILPVIGIGIACSDRPASGQGTPDSNPRSTDMKLQERYCCIAYHVLIASPLRFK
jgi:hypothetical protein